MLPEISSVSSVTSFGFVWPGVRAAFVPRGRAPAAPFAAPAWSTFAPAPVSRRIVGDGFELVVAEPEATPDAAFIDVCRRTCAELAQIFGPLTSPLRLQLGGTSTSLRLSYRPNERLIFIPTGGASGDAYLHDHDRLRHELFHAYLAARRPELFTPAAIQSPEVQALHEGLADFFTSLRDDDIFGNGAVGYDLPTRRYRNALLYGLTSGSHARGNALTSWLLASGAGASTLAAFAGRGAYTLSRLRAQVGGEVEGGFEAHVDVRLGESKPSRLQRFRVRGSSELSFAFTGVPAATVVTRVRLTDAKGRPVHGFRFVPIASDVPGVVRFRLEVQEPRAAAKVIAHFEGPGGERVGFSVLYFSTRPTS